MYEKFLAGEVLRGQPKWAHKGPFTIQRLLLIGYLNGGLAYWVNEESEWARWGKVGGVIINRRRREWMSESHLREWLSELEEVSA